MTRSGLLSIILPAYNEEQVLPLLRQRLAAMAPARVVEPSNSTREFPDSDDGAPADDRATATISRKFLVAPPFKQAGGRIL